MMRSINQANRGCWLTSLQFGARDSQDFGNCFEIQF